MSVLSHNCQGQLTSWERLSRFLEQARKWRGKIDVIFLCEFRYTRTLRDAHMKGLWFTDQDVRIYANKESKTAWLVRKEVVPAIAEVTWFKQASKIALRTGLKGGEGIAVILGVHAPHSPADFSSHLSNLGVLLRKRTIGQWRHVVMWVEDFNVDVMGDHVKERKILLPKRKVKLLEKSVAAKGLTRLVPKNESDASHIEVITEQTRCAYYGSSLTRRSEERK